jgi:hypothetical protein
MCSKLLRFHFGTSNVKSKDELKTIEHIYARKASISKPKTETVLKRMLTAKHQEELKATMAANDKAARVKDKQKVMNALATIKAARLKKERKEKRKMEMALREQERIEKQERKRKDDRDHKELSELKEKMLKIEKEVSSKLNELDVATKRIEKVNKKIKNRIMKDRLHEECTICYEPFDVKSTRKNGKTTISMENVSITNCNHVFHSTCIDQWLENDDDVSCPLCRTKLLD